MAGITLLKRANIAPLYVVGHVYKDVKEFYFSRSKLPELAKQGLHAKLQIVCRSEEDCQTVLAALNMHEAVWSSKKDIGPEACQQQWKATSSASPSLAVSPTLGSPWQTTAPCSANAACRAQGLDGDCCPTSAGLFLGCCSQP